MTGEQIIAKFRTWVDDGTELSATDELDLLNQVYLNVWLDRPWEFAKKGRSETINGTDIALPADFSHILETEVNEEQKKVVWVDDKYYEVINFSDRRNYTGKDGYCWVDIANNKLEFTKLVYGTLTYDYIYTPDDLTLSAEPAFPARFHHCIYHLMAADDYIIQQFDKARSYAKENEEKAQAWITKMAYWNASLQV